VNVGLAGIFYMIGITLRGPQGGSDVSGNWGSFQMFITGTKLKMSGVENVPKTGGFILISNHRSFFDIFSICIACPRNVRWVVKGSLLNYFILGVVLKWIRAVGLDRGNPREAIKELIKSAKEIREEGEGVCIFPEGTRSKTEDLLPFKTGAMVLAEKAGVPIIPVVIDGTQNVLRAKGLLVNCCKTITLKFLDPIDPTTFGKNRLALTEAVRARMVEELKK